ncbi:hypothetical protein J6590_039812 [Homalodisca vitripennis]|nr:hypothetical protein J6590_039812 [Homalodisca vitripennis]
MKGRPRRAESSGEDGRTPRRTALEKSREKGAAHSRREVRRTVSVQPTRLSGTTAGVNLANWISGALLKTNNRPRSLLPLPLRIAKRPGKIRRPASVLVSDPGRDWAPNWIMCGDDWRGRVGDPIAECNTAQMSGREVSFKTVLWSELCGRNLCLFTYKHFSTT